MVRIRVFVYLVCAPTFFTAVIILRERSTGLHIKLNQYVPFN